MAGIRPRGKAVEYPWRKNENEKTSYCTLKYTGNEVAPGNKGTYRL
jgi:hypothetical protein